MNKNTKRGRLQQRKDIAAALASCELKRCKRCLSLRHYSDFWRNSSNKSGLTSRCSVCMRETVNKEAIARGRLKYRTVNRDKFNASNKAWREANREKINESARKWSAKRRGTPIGNLQCRIRCGVRGYIKDRRPGQRTFDILGYTGEELKTHIEKQFLQNMGWHNSEKWHIDHIIPSSSFDLSVFENVKRCWSLPNLRPLWAAENIRKGAKHVSLL